MTTRNLPLLVIAAALSGCASLDNRPCVAVVNPNEVVLNGKVLEKEQVSGTVAVAVPEGRKITEDPRVDGAYGVLGGLSTLGPAGVAAGMVYLNTLPVTPPPPTIGDKCQDTAHSVTNGYRYLVAAEDGNKYAVLSAYPGFEVGECSKLFLVPKPQGGFTGRIAGNGSCNGVP